MKEPFYDKWFTERGFECDTGASMPFWEKASDKDRIFYLMTHLLWMAKYDKSVSSDDVIKAILSIPEVNTLVDLMDI